ncbi:MAG: Diphthine synthase [Candidatus Methanolliviera sp. GoM_asphalt]|nr:MAG: Diphthine synthase [Candidatus Methanolliviera sp. GoM_asphalt]
MLTFVGLGLYDERDISLKGLYAVKNSDYVFAEFYTSRLMGTDVRGLEKFYGKDVYELKREDVEIHAEKIIEKAKRDDVCLLCGGDPMMATTHVDLRMRAHDAGVETKIIHGSSIQTAAIGICGLQNYKFGRSSTIARPYKDKIPETPYDVLVNNLKNNLHTLFFLDLSEAPMAIREGLEILLNIQERRKEEILDIGIGIARAGSEDVRVKADFIEELMKYNFGPPLHLLIIPSKLHFMEAEALVKFADAPKEIMER